MRFCLNRTPFAASILLALLAAPSRAEDFPARPVTMIVPFAAGGTSDVIARIVADRMGAILGQRIVNENVAGAGGANAMTRLARAEPDGYTIAIGNAGTNAATYTIYPDLKFKPDAFEPVGIVAKTVGALAVRKDFPAADLAEFVAFAKKNPGKVTLGHAGIGSSNYLICRIFMQAAGVEVTLVSYRGAGPALTDAMGGQIDGVCDSATSLSGAILDDKVRGLAVTAPQRLATLPKVPTSAEGGLPDFEYQGWNALFVPKGTSAPVIERLNAVAREAVASDTVQNRFRDLSTLVPTGEEQSPEFTRKFVASEIERFAKLLK
jgi:tripartite-type tricarboxylate transporter receptor subunit TctC